MPYQGSYYPAFGRTQQGLQGLASTFQGLGQNIALRREREMAHELAMQGLDIKRAGLEAEQKMSLLNLEADAKKAKELREHQKYLRDASKRREERDIISAQDRADTQALTRKRLRGQMEDEEYERQPMSIRGMFLESGLKDEAIDEMINSSPFEPKGPYQVDKSGESGYMETVTEHKFPGDPERHELAVENNMILFNHIDRRDIQRKVWHELRRKYAEANPELNNIIQRKELRSYHKPLIDILNSDKNALTPEAAQKAKEQIENDPYHPAKVDEFEAVDEMGATRYEYNVRPFTRSELQEKSFTLFDSQMKTRHREWYNNILMKNDVNKRIEIMTELYNALESAGSPENKKKILIRYGVIPITARNKRSVPSAPKPGSASNDVGLESQTKKKIESPPIATGSFGRAITEEEYMRTPAGLAERGLKATGRGLATTGKAVGKGVMATGKWMVDVPTYESTITAGIGPKRESKDIFEIAKQSRADYLEKRSAEKKMVKEKNDRQVLAKRKKIIDRLKRTTWWKKLSGEERKRIVSATMSESDIIRDATEDMTNAEKKLFTSEYIQR